MSSTSSPLKIKDTKSLSESNNQQNSMKELMYRKLGPNGEKITPLLEFQISGSINKKSLISLTSECNGIIDCFDSVGPNEISM
jgi:hypothetical protein